MLKTIGRTLKAIKYLRKFTKEVSLRFTAGCNCHVWTALAKQTHSILELDVKNQTVKDYG